MPTDPGLQDPLQAFLSGKRSALRHAIELPVRVQTASASLPARTLDVSEGGVLIGIAQASLLGVEGAGEQDFLTVVERDFGDGFDVHFPQQKVAVEAEIVRLAMRPGDDDYLFMGCRFREPLTRRQMRALGLVAGGAEEGGEEDTAYEAVPMEVLPFVADPRRPVFALLFDPAEDLVGPRYVGPLTGLGRRTLAMRIEDADPTAVRARLEDHPLLVRTMDGSRCLAEVEAALLAALYVDGPTRGTEVTLLASQGLGRRLRRAFLKRRPA